MKNYRWLARVFLYSFLAIFFYPTSKLVFSAFTIEDSFHQKTEFSLNAWRDIFQQPYVQKYLHQVAFITESRPAATFNRESIQLQLSPAGLLMLDYIDPALTQCNCAIEIRTTTKFASATKPSLVQTTRIPLKDGGEQSFMVPLHWSPDTLNNTIELSIPTLQSRFMAPVFLTYLRTTLFALAAAITITLVSIPFAYAIAQTRFILSRQIYTGLVLAQLFPNFLMLTAYTVIIVLIKDSFPILGFNSLLTVFIIFIGNLSLCTLLIHSYFKELDPTVSEAAFMEGASHHQVLRLITVPMALPMISAAFLVTYLYCYSEFVISNQLLLTTDKHLLSTMINNTRVSLSWAKGNTGIVAAYNLLAVVPILVIFFLLRPWLSRSLDH